MWAWRFSKGKDIQINRIKVRGNDNVSENIKLPKDIWQLDESYKNVIRELSKK